jgi:hypothetical protein
MKKLQSVSSELTVGSIRWKKLCIDYGKLVNKLKKLPEEFFLVLFANFKKYKNGC